MALGAAVLLGSLLTGISKLLTVEFVKFIAFRALIYTGMTLILPVILYNVWSLILSETLAYVTAHVGDSGLEGSMIQLVGIAAWCAGLLRIPDAVSFLLSCALCRFVISMVRGV